MISKKQTFDSKPFNTLVVEEYLKALKQAERQNSDSSKCLKIHQCCFVREYSITLEILHIFLLQRNKL